MTTIIVMILVALCLYLSWCALRHYDNAQSFRKDAAHWSSVAGKNQDEATRWRQAAKTAALQIEGLQRQIATSVDIVDKYNRIIEIIDEEEETNHTLQQEVAEYLKS